MESNIEVRGLRKRYGSAVAVDGLSFTVTPGQVTGFVGPNGAGKSTTMRMIMGLDRPDEGTALVGGRPYRTLRNPLTLMSELEGSVDHLVVIGRGQLIADRSVRDLLAATSGGRIVLRTAKPQEGMAVLANAGATVAATDRDAVTVSGMPAETRCPSPGSLSAARHWRRCTWSSPMTPWTSVPSRRCDDHDVVSSRSSSPAGD